MPISPSKTYRVRTSNMHDENIKRNIQYLQKLNQKKNPKIPHSLEVYKLNTFLNSKAA